MVFSGSSCKPSLARVPQLQAVTQMDSRTQRTPHLTLRTAVPPITPKGGTHQMRARLTSVLGG